MYQRKHGQQLERQPAYSFSIQQHGNNIHIYIVMKVTLAHYEWLLLIVLSLLSFSANNFALKGKRKTLNASDVFSALEDMEFEQFVPELKDCLEGAYFAI